MKSYLKEFHRLAYSSYLQESSQSPEDLGAHADKLSQKAPKTAKDSAHSYASHEAAHAAHTDAAHAYQQVGNGEKSKYHQGKADEHHKTLKSLKRKSDDRLLPW
jgi:hypothetical protein